MQLFENLTANDIFAWILLNRSGDSRGILLVESGYDAQVYEAHLEPSDMTTIACGGRPTALQVMDIVNQQTVERVCASVDADVHAVMGTPLPDHVFTTEFCDLESEAFFGPEGGQLFIEPLLPPGRTHANQIGEDLRALLALVSAVGGLRLISVRDGLDFKLADLPFGRVLFCRRGEVVDVALLATIIAARSRNGASLKDYVEQKLDHLLALPHDQVDFRLCNGHDICQVLSIYIKERGGPAVSGKTLESFLKLSLHKCHIFSQVPLRATLDHWGSSQGLTVWHQPCAGLQSPRLRA